jgi:integrase
MPRRSEGARLYRDTKREQYVIRDGSRFVRTGCSTADRERAEAKLAEYIVARYKPAASDSPMIADVLMLYAKEHLPGKASARKSAYNIQNLSRFWGLKRATDISVMACKDYARPRPHSAARRDLEVLRAATMYWHKNKHALATAPVFWLPEKEEPRDRWLTKDEARRLRKAAMKTPHLYRFVMLGLKTGSRSGVLFTLQWSWIDLEHGVMRRRAPGEADSKTKRKPPVRLGKSFVRLLRLWRRHDKGMQYVVHHRGVPVKTVERSWREACRAAEIEGASPHTLRHTVATWLAQAGVPPFEAAGFLGMSVATYLRTYAKHHPDFQSRAAEVL